METSSTNINFPKESKNENVEIFVRLRGYTKLPDHFIKGRTKSPNPKTINLKSTTRDSTYTETNKKSNSSLKNKTSKTLTESNNSKKKLIFNYLYYMFTTYPKCNKIAITQDGLNGTCIMNNLKTEKDLLKIFLALTPAISLYMHSPTSNTGGSLIIPMRSASEGVGLNTILFPIKSRGRILLLISEIF